jgi:type I restriction enzyme, S subunit
MIEKKKFEELYFFHPKSKILAGEGGKEEKFPFYTSSAVLSKRIEKAGFNTQALIFGTGGSASIHYADGQFNVSTDCLVASSKQEEVNIKYTYYYLLYNLHILEKGFKGAGLKHISKGYIEKIDISYPEFEVQNKIVAILDKANSLIEKREETIGKCDELLRATFLEMFLKFQGANVQSLDNVAYVVSGLTKGKNYKGKSTNLYPYMRVANVQDGYLDLNEIKEIEATEEEATRYELEEDDLLLTEGGDPDKLGRGTLWKNQIDNCIYQNHIFRVRAKDREVINPTFLSYQLSSQYGKAYFLKAAKQTSGIASINSTQLKSFPVYIPPSKEQTRFEVIANKCKASQQTLIENTQSLRDLLNSLSQLAFKGELTFNAAIGLETLFNNVDLDKTDEENDIGLVHTNSAILSLLISRLNKQDFGSMNQYDKGKYVAFRVLKEREGLINQTYNPEEEKIEITVS